MVEYYKTGGGWRRTVEESEAEFVDVESYRELQSRLDIQIEANDTLLCETRELNKTIEKLYEALGNKEEVVAQALQQGREQERERIMEKAKTHHNNYYCPRCVDIKSNGEKVFKALDGKCRFCKDGDMSPSSNIVMKDFIKAIREED